MHADVLFDAFRGADAHATPAAVNARWRVIRLARALYRRNAHRLSRCHDVTPRPCQPAAEVSVTESPERLVKPPRHGADMTLLDDSLRAAACALVAKQPYRASDGGQLPDLDYYAERILHALSERGIITRRHAPGRRHDARRPYSQFSAIAADVANGYRSARRQQ